MHHDKVASNATNDTHQWLLHAFHMLAISHTLRRRSLTAPSLNTSLSPAYDLPHTASEQALCKEDRAVHHGKWQCMRDRKEEVIHKVVCIQGTFLDGKNAPEFWSDDNAMALNKDESKVDKESDDTLCRVLSMSLLHSHKWWSQIRGKEDRIHCDKAIDKYDVHNPAISHKSIQ